jgi:hypothetical protein
MEEQFNRILAKMTSIEEKLDKVIKAMQEHDGVGEDFNEPYDEYAWENINSAAAEMYNKFHDEASWEEESNKRIDVIGQNGNEGTHYQEKPKPKKKPYYKNKTKKNGNS